MDMEQETSIPSLDIPEELKDLLPSGFEYRLTRFRSEASFSNEPRFECDLRSKIFNREQGIRWAKEFQKKSLTTLRISQTFPQNSQRLIYKVGYRCQHNTKPRANTKKIHSKHTKCMAKLRLTINQRVKRGATKDIQNEFPCVIGIDHIHNHPVNDPVTLSHRDLAPEIKAKFITLLSYHTPSTALKIHQQDVLYEHGDNFDKVTADGAIMPKLMDVFHLYYKLGGDTLMKNKLCDSINELHEELTQYNINCGRSCAIMELSGSSFDVAICSPLMSRVHLNCPQAADVVCLDSAHTSARFQCKVYLLMVNSSVGGLPLAVLLTNSKSKAALNGPLTLLKQILPESSFYGRGLDGPSVLVTNDDFHLKKCLREEFSQSLLLEAVSQILKDAWVFVWKEKSIAEQDRLFLFSLIKAMVQSQTEVVLEQNYQLALNHAISKKYTAFEDFCNDLHSRKADWGLCYSRARLPNGHDLSESALSALRDKVLLRSRAYTVSQLFQYLTVDMEKYYERKVLKMLSGSPALSFRMEFLGAQVKHVLEVSQANISMAFNVHNEQTGTTYIVDLSASCCTCPIGLNRGACVHQFAAYEHSGLSALQFSSIANDVKRALHYAVTGTINIPPGWYTDVPNSLDSAKDASTDSSNKDYKNLASEAKSRLKQFYDDLMLRIDRQPDRYCGTVNEFLEQYLNCDTDSERLSTLLPQSCNLELGWVGVESLATL